jgi:hypothetical protein
MEDGSVKWRCSLFFSFFLNYFAVTEVGAKSRSRLHGILVLIVPSFPSICSVPMQDSFWKGKGDRRGGGEQEATKQEGKLITKVWFGLVWA